MIGQIQLEILTELPAWEAHKKMMPPSRKPSPNLPANVRYSAVCILLFHKQEGLHTILIKRTEDGGTHSGQIGLPGGKLDEDDFSLTHCALRECEEEIGLDKKNLHILGKMTELFIPPSNYIVTPIVCSSQQVEHLVPSPDEVDEIIEVPLAELFLDQNKITKEVWRSADNKLSMVTPVYQYNDHVIWGATAMMLAELEEIYKRVI